MAHIYLYIYIYLYVYIPTLTFIHLCKIFCDPQMNAGVLRAKYYCFIVAGKQLSILRALLANVQQKSFNCLLEMRKLITFNFIGFLGKKYLGILTAFK